MPAIIIATFGVAAAITGEAALSYSASAIMLTLLLINMICDWLHDFLGPRVRHIG